MDDTLKFTLIILKIILKFKVKLQRNHQKKKNIVFTRSMQKGPFSLETNEDTAKEKTDISNT